MILQLASVLPPAEVAQLISGFALADDSFSSGKATAGWHAKDVKHNDQASGVFAQKTIEQIKETLLANPVLISAARPKSFVKILVSRYRPGMHYGTHVDDALMGGNARICRSRCFSRTLPTMTGVSWSSKTMMGKPT